MTKPSDYQKTQLQPYQRDAGEITNGIHHRQAWLMRQPGLQAQVPSYANWTAYFLGRNGMPDKIPAAMEKASGENFSVGSCAICRTSAIASSR